MDTTAASTAEKLLSQASVAAGKLTPWAVGYWTDLYQHGKLAGQDENVLLLILIRLAAAVLILLAARILVAVLRKGIAQAVTLTAARGGGGSRRLSTLQALLASSIAYLVYFGAIVLVLFTFGLKQVLTPLLGAASVLGLAVGFGAQKLVRDVITGLFILGEGQFDVGEWVSIGNVTGRVEDIGLRVTRIRDDQGRLYTIANGDITQVFNASRGLVKLSVDVSVSRQSSLEGALETVRQIAEDTLHEHAGGAAPAAEPLSVLVVGMDAGKFTVRAVLWVPVAAKERTEDALRRRLLDEFAGERLLLA